MRPIDADKLPAHKFQSPVYLARKNGKTILAAYQKGWNDAIDAIIDNEPTVEYPEQITIKCVTEKDRQKLLSALKSARVTEYIEFERPQGRWIPVGERLPEGKIDPMTKDFELVLCSTVWNDVRPYKFGKPIGHAEAHFWWGCGVMDDYVIAWQPLPEPYKEAENDL